MYDYSVLKYKVSLLYNTDKNRNSYGIEMEKTEINNLFNNIPNKIPDEIVECILKNQILTIERIISKGHNTPAGQYYDQDNNEWIIILQGQARLSFEEPHEEISMEVGDYLLIPEHKRHRVEWTKPDIETLWLAIHFNRIL